VAQHRRALFRVVDAARGPVVEDDRPDVRVLRGQVERKPHAHREPDDTDGPVRRRMRAQPVEARGGAPGRGLVVQLCGQRLGLLDRPRRPPGAQVRRQRHEALLGQAVAEAANPVAEAPPRVEHEHAGAAARRGGDVAGLSLH